MAKSPRDKYAQDTRWERVEISTPLGHRRHAMRPRVGARFDKLVVLEPGMRLSGRTKCVCDCGSEYTITNETLNDPIRTKQCFRCALKPRSEAAKLHRDLFTDAQYHTWGHRYTGMLRRCYNPKCPEYKNYGGRGVEVYGEWRTDKRKFFEYVVKLENWDDLTTDMDRINNNAGYFPGNIRLVPRIVNACNRRDNTILEYKGVRYIQEEFYRKHLPNWKSINALTYHLGRGRSLDWIVAKHDEGRKGLRPIKLRSE